MMERYLPNTRPFSALLLGFTVLFTTTLQAQSSGTAPQGLQNFDASVYTVGPVGPVVGDGAAQGGEAPNATCAGAVVNSLAVGTPVTVTGDNTGAVVDPIFNALVVWEAFTTTECANITVGYCGTNPSFVGSLITLGVGCPLTNLVFNSPNNIQPNACGDGNFTISFPNLPAGTYYFPVLQGPGSVGAYTLTFTATACTATAPANAVCEGAIPLASAAECTPVSGDVTNATVAGNTGLGCGNGDVADGVWYSFEATETAYDITVAPSDQFNAHFEVFSGECDALTSIACSVGANFGIATEASLTGLTVGETYYVRVNDWYSGNPVTTTFFICLESIAQVECDANAGTLTANSEVVCLANDLATINATANGDAVVPDGFQTLFVLTTGEDPVIVQGALTPAFDVTTAGTYTIHTLVYDDATLDLNGLVFGQTTAASINALLLQGGGGICASLDLAGAPIVVQECLPCAASAGTITINDGTACFEGDPVTISATPNGNDSVPAGFETVYVLTSGQDLVIEAAAATPSFEVTTTGLYIIHTLVYDPTTLDLSTIVFGETTGGAVNGLLIQGGGTICASLDVAGAPITVASCCTADAGTLQANFNTVCFIDGSATIDATPGGNAEVPDGFETIYLLTTGEDLIIQQGSFTPAFVVTATGDYTIHTLVYDDATLDLGTLVFGVTSGVDVNATLIQGGGSICAGLDVTGAPISVELCCGAEAGTLIAEDANVCFPNGPITISATVDTEPVVPTDFQTVYVLTSGTDLVIEAAGASPSFEVDAAGLYTIHTLVYDPATLDLSIIEFGETTGVTVNGLLIQGGGTICAALDVTGAPINVEDCSPLNDDCANAIELAINAEGNCPDAAYAGDNTYATQETGNEPGCDDTEVAYADVWYTFNSGDNTEVTITLDEGTMTDWAITVSDACTGGEELACETLPTQPLVIATEENTVYWVRIYSNLEFGTGGEFGVCISGASPTFICNGGSVTTTDGEAEVSICQNGQPDVLDFSTTSTAVENYAFVATDENNTIVTLLAGNSLDFNALPLGTYRVWGISYNGTLEGTAPGALATEITSTGACIGLSSDFVTVNVEICSGINDQDASSWSLFPNPNNGQFNLRYAGVSATTVIEVVDINGRMVMQEQVSLTNGQVHTMAANGVLAQGVYSVRLLTGNTAKTIRLVVQ